MAVCVAGSTQLVAVGGLRAYSRISGHALPSARQLHRTIAPVAGIIGFSTYCSIWSSYFEKTVEAHPDLSHIKQKVLSVRPSVTAIYTSLDPRLWPTDTSCVDSTEYTGIAGLVELYVSRIWTSYPTGEKFAAQLYPEVLSGRLSLHDFEACVTLLTRGADAASFVNGDVSLFAATFVAILVEGLTAERWRIIRAIARPFSALVTPLCFFMPLAGYYQHANYLAIKDPKAIRKVLERRI